MLNIGSDNIAMTLDEWSESQELKKTYPYFRDYLNIVYSAFFE